MIRNPNRGCRTALWVLMLVSPSLAACGGPFSPTQPPGSNLIQVVAAENFYGDIVQQLGAGHVSVVSILSDPNVDPHEYEFGIQNGVAVARAQLVIENGSGYDSWMDKLISASPNSRRIVVVAYDICGEKLPDNPHVWYSVADIMTVARAVTADLEQLQPAYAREFDAALAKFDASLDPIIEKLAELETKYSGTPIGLTESIFLYQSGLMGLKVLTPFEFEKAIAEGNDPPAITVVAANNQIRLHQIKLLIYNSQTVTPITTNLESEAELNHIPIVPVSETMPPGKNYQSWMLGQLVALQAALAP